MHVKTVFLSPLVFQCVLARSEDGQYLVKTLGMDYTHAEWVDFPIDSKGVCNDPALALAIQTFREGEATFEKVGLLHSGRTLLKLPPVDVFCTGVSLHR